MYLVPKVKCICGTIWMIEKWEVENAITCSCGARLHIDTDPYRPARLIISIPLEENSPVLVGWELRGNPEGYDE